MLHMQCSETIRWKYNGSCILKPSVQPEKIGLKLNLVLICRNVYIEHMTEVSFSLQKEGS